MNPGHQTKINAERNDETILRQHLIGEKLLAPLPAAPLRARVKTCTTVRQVFRKLSGLRVRSEDEYTLIVRLNKLKWAEGVPA